MLIYKDARRIPPNSIEILYEIGAVNFIDFENSLNKRRAGYVAAARERQGSRIEDGNTRNEPEFRCV